MGGSRSTCCVKEGLKRGPWTAEEDQKLTSYIQQHGHGSWSSLPEKAGLKRCGKSCRLRWINYLRPDIKRGNFSLQEEQTIIQLHAFLGNRWSAIAAHLPKRTDNEIKNHWNTHLKKRLIKMGIDPITHKPRIDTLGSPTGQGSNHAANLSHMAQWERARLEAEARSARDSNQQALPNFPSVQVQQKMQLGSQTPKPMCLDVLKAWQGIVTGMFNLPYNDDLNLEFPSRTSISNNFSNVPIQVPIDDQDVDCNIARNYNLYTYYNELEHLNKFNQMQEFDDGTLAESTYPSIPLQGTYTTYSRENTWTSFMEYSNYGEENVNEAMFVGGFHWCSSYNFIKGSRDIKWKCPSCSNFWYIWIQIKWLIKESFGYS